MRDSLTEGRLFLPDGVGPTAYAAQPLVAKGIAVLQMRGGGSELDADSRFVASIDAVVDALAGRRLIDPSRVGVLGWSYGAQKTFYAITHPGRTKLAAAIAADGSPSGSRARKIRNPTKAAHYARWRQMKLDWENVR